MFHFSDEEGNAKIGDNSISSVRGTQKSFQSGSGGNCLLKNAASDSFPYKLQEKYDELSQSLTKEKELAKKAAVEETATAKLQDDNPVITTPKVIEDDTDLKKPSDENQQNLYGQKNKGVYFTGKSPNLRDVFIDEQGHIREAPTSEDFGNGYSHWATESSGHLTAEIPQWGLQMPPACPGEPLTEEDGESDLVSEGAEMRKKRQSKKMMNLFPQQFIHTGPTYPYLYHIIEPPKLDEQNQYQPPGHLDQCASLRTYSSGGSNITVKEGSAEMNKQTQNTKNLLPTSEASQPPFIPEIPVLSPEVNTGQEITDFNVSNMQIPRQTVEHSNPELGEVVTDNSLPNYYIPPATQKTYITGSDLPQITTTPPSSGSISHQTPPPLGQFHQYSRSMSPKFTSEQGHESKSSPRESEGRINGGSLPCNSHELNDTKRVVKAEELTKRFQAITSPNGSGEISSTSGASNE